MQDKRMSEWQQFMPALMGEYLKSVATVRLDLCLLPRLLRSATQLRLCLNRHRRCGAPLRHQPLSEQR
jgi:hypothetical protein